MKRNGKGSNVFGLVIATIFFLVGCACIYGFITTAVRNASWGSTTATVIHVDVWAEDGKLWARETYEYYVDGERYEERSSSVKSANSSRYEGQTFTIKYDTENPEKTFSENLMVYSILGLGLVFVVMSVGAWVSVFKEIKNNK